MNARKLDMLHNRRDKCMCTVGDGVCLALKRMVQETVNQNRTVRRYADCRVHVFGHLVVIVHNLHAAAAEHVGRTNHDRIADLLRDADGILNRNRHSGLGHRDTELVHHCAEEVTVLSEVDDCGRSSEDLHTVLLKGSRKVQRRLAAELCDDTERLLLLVDAEYILQGKRLKVKLVRRVVVGGNRLRVAVDDDGLEAELLKSHRRMYAAVVELDTLADTVRAAA